MSKDIYSLATKSPFLEGFSRFFDFSRYLDISEKIVKYEFVSSSSEADYKAILLDWCKVGEDIYKAMQMLEAESLEVENDE